VGGQKFLDRQTEFLYQYRAWVCWHATKIGVWP